MQDKTRQIKAIYDTEKQYNTIHDNTTQDNTT